MGLYGNGAWRYPLGKWSCAGRALRPPSTPSAQNRNLAYEDRWGSVGGARVLNVISGNPGKIAAGP